jgi:NAD-dependent dihydropyrimidine dehydrogenase PreA subunit
MLLTVFLRGIIMKKAYIVKKKCAAQPVICKPMQQCPEKAFSFIENEDEPLGGHMELDGEKCTGCGICVTLCCGDSIELR